MNSRIDVKEFEDYIDKHHGWIEYISDKENKKSLYFNHKGCFKVILDDISFNLKDIEKAVNLYNNRKIG